MPVCQPASRTLEISSILSRYPSIVLFLDYNDPAQLLWDFKVPMSYTYPIMVSLSISAWDDLLYLEAIRDKSCIFSI